MQLHFGTQFNITYSDPLKGLNYANTLKKNLEAKGFPATIGGRGETLVVQTDTWTPNGMIHTDEGLVLMQTELQIGKTSLTQKADGLHIHVN